VLTGTNKVCDIAKPLRAAHLVSGGTASKDMAMPLPSFDLKLKAAVHATSMTVQCRLGLSTVLRLAPVQVAFSVSARFAAATTAALESVVYRSTDALLSMSAPHRHSAKLEQSGKVCRVSRSPLN
jgi:hypothetical protein